MCDAYCCPDGGHTETREKKPYKELKGGIYTRCDCGDRNGLQDLCGRLDCTKGSSQVYNPRPTRTEKSFETLEDVIGKASAMNMQSTSMPLRSMPARVQVQRNGIGDNYSNFPQSTSTTTYSQYTPRMMQQPQSYPLYNRSPNLLGGYQTVTQQVMPSEQNMGTTDQMSGIGQDSMLPLYYPQPNMGQSIGSQPGMVMSNLNNLSNLSNLSSLSNYGQGMGSRLSNFMSPQQPIMGNASYSYPPIVDNRSTNFDSYTPVGDSFPVDSGNTSSFEGYQQNNFYPCKTN